jgi:hypothetical protein
MFVIGFSFGVVAGRVLQWIVSNNVHFRGR